MSEGQKCEMCREYNAAAVDYRNEAANLRTDLATIRARVARLEDLVQTLLDEDPNEQIADNGSTVLCAWRYDARRALEEK